MRESMLVLDGISEKDSIAALSSEQLTTWLLSSSTRKLKWPPLLDVVGKDCFPILYLLFPLLDLDSETELDGRRIDLTELRLDGEQLASKVFLDEQVF